MTQRPFRCLVALCLTAIFAKVPAATAWQDRPTVWDLHLGIATTELPDGFADYACGSAGGPPGRPLTAFTDYAECRADNDGLHEVYFRYDDEPEYIARALEQARAIDFYAGTRVLGFPATLTALFDEGGLLQGIRIATDPRGVEPGERNDHWLLAPKLMQRFGLEDWDCTDIPPEAGETPIAPNFFIKEHCSKSTDVAGITVSREYLHRRGQIFVDEFGKAQPTLFISTTTFEMRATKRPE